MKELILISPKTSRTVIVYYYKPIFNCDGSFTVLCEVYDGADILHIRVATHNAPLIYELNDIEREEERQPRMHTAFYPEIEKRIKDWLFLKH